MNAFLFLVATLSGASAMAAPLDVSKLEGMLGMKGTARGDEYKFSVPHPELPLRVDGFRIVPFMGTTSWVAFTPHEDGAMAMGDLVLLEDEVKPVQAAAVEAGLQVTAIHNHFLRDEPKVMYMHVGGMGTQEGLARSVRQVFDAQRKARVKARFKPALLDDKTQNPVELDIDTEAVSGIIGHPGSIQDHVFKIVVARPDVPLMDMGTKVSSFMGFNTWMAFQGTAKRAAVAGDFAMLDKEVDGVIRALISRGIEVAAVHNHMVAETPRITFLHFWGVGPAEDLAKSLRAALDGDVRQQP